MGVHMDIRPLPRRMQERGRGTDAQAVFNGALGVRDALLDRAVVIGVSGNAERHRTRHEGFAERVLPAHGGDGQITLAPAKRVFTSAAPPLDPLELRQPTRLPPPSVA